MKKLVALSMTLALALSLTACGGGSFSTTATTGGGGAGTTAASKDSGADTTAASQDDKSGTPDAAPAGDVVVMTLASNHTQDFVTSLACKHFAEQVEEKTGGAVKIECYFDAVLGEETATLEQCQYGGIDFIRVSMSPLAEFVPAYSSMQLPYIYSSREHFWKVMDAPDIGQELLTSDGMTSNGLYGLAYYDNGTRNFFFSSNEVHGVKDMAGLTLRVQESDLMIGMVKAMGANPVAMAASELYSSLQTGVVSGAENNLPWYLSMSLNEVAPLITMDEHTRTADMLIMSEKSKEKVTAEQLQIIEECAAESSQYQRELWAKSEEEARQQCIDAGCTIIDLTDEERQSYMDCVTELNAQFGEEYKDILDKIAAMK